MMRSSSQPAVVVRDVSKRFRLYHERASSLKERVVSLRRSRYEEFWALRNVTCEVRAGETFGLIGANGSGKSTLLKCVAGILRPDEGYIETRGRVASLLELGAGFHPDLTGRENVYLNASILGLSKKETDRHFDGIVAFAELEQFVDSQVKHYSSGMYVRLGFAVAIHVDPEILIVDEVLAVGDEAFQRKCLARIRDFQREGRTIVFVTHAVDLVRDICGTAAFLSEGRIAKIGSPQEVVLAFRDEMHGRVSEGGGGRTTPDGRRCTGDISILSVRITDPNGVERREFSAGDPMEIVIDLEAVRAVPDPHVGIALSDQGGRVVFGTNTARRGVKLDLTQGKARVRFSFPDQPLQEGTYLVTVGVHSRDDQIAHDWLEEAESFRCINRSPDVGTVRALCEVAVEPL